MLNKINQWLESTLNIGVQSDSEQHTTELAAAILLIEVSRADFEISKDEQKIIGNVLTQQFSLSSNEADKVLQYALQEHDEYSSSHPFIRLINEELDAQAKLGLLKGLWSVAYADGVLDKYEEYHIRKIADWLYLSHADFIRVKHQVLEKLNIKE
ncbi:MAG: TerB family tellurite resistance protein [Gammaproteobacteria bacterium]|nr:TerB family tellurite resistance protein [Gammaproteobacteria bacterium]